MLKIRCLKPVFFLGIIPLTTLLGCSDVAGISGTLELSEDGHWKPMVYLIQPQELMEVAGSFQGTLIDSAEVKSDGSFAFKNLPDAPEPILLELTIQPKGTRYVNQKDNDSILNSNYMPLLWGNGQRFRIKAAAAHFQQSFTIENPSDENKELLRLRDVRLAAFQQHLDGKTWDVYYGDQLLKKEAAQLRYQEQLMAFADSTQYFYPAMVALRWVSPQSDYQRVPEFLDAQCKKWGPLNPETPWTASLCAMAQKLPVKVGDRFPATTLPLVTGDTLALEGLMGKRLTIIDLWASWCAPCRKENREVLLPLWIQYHTEGFQIVGYALESSQLAWKKALEVDGVDLWPQASHLEGDEGPFLKLLQLQTIPANFLLDEEGNVLAKNLHGRALKDFVKAYLEN